MEDVWDVVDLLIQEIKDNNMIEGNEFDIAESINSQLPFFTCRNYFLTPEIQRDIQRYVYCKDLGTNAYKGSYGEQPALWVDKYFIIKKAFAHTERKQIAQSKERKNK
tara:strand:- start:1110 stop:1433 length:324 start_codon:yes stop_codon:yes gene_type:complete